LDIFSLCDIAMAVLTAQQGGNPVDREVANVKITNGVHSNAAGKDDISSILHQQISKRPSKIISGKGNYLISDTGLEIFDASCGAAVACIGHGNPRVKDAIVRQLDQVAYCYLPFFTTEPAEILAKELVDSTGGLMTKVFIVSSGENSSCISANLST
jgi:adenosylmethionine-8-amino-7-oxononanoate aminotransferase